MEHSGKDKTYRKHTALVRQSVKSISITKMPDLLHDLKPVK